MNIYHSSNASATPIVFIFCLGGLTCKGFINTPRTEYAGSLTIHRLWPIALGIHYTTWQIETLAPRPVSALMNSDFVFGGGMMDCQLVHSLFLS